MKLCLIALGISVAANLWLCCLYLLERLDKAEMVKDWSRCEKDERRLRSLLSSISEPVQIRDLDRKALVWIDMGALLEQAKK